MERFDIGEGDRLAEMVIAAERGEEVEIMRDGTVVAHLVVPTPAASPDRRAPQFDPAAWEKLHRLTAPLRGVTGAELIRQSRDMDD